MVRHVRSLLGAATSLWAAEESMQLLREQMHVGRHLRSLHGTLCLPRLAWRLPTSHVHRVHLLIQTLTSPQPPGPAPPPPPPSLALPQRLVLQCGCELQPDEAISILVGQFRGLAGS